MEVHARKHGRKSLQGVYRDEQVAGGTGSAGVQGVTQSETDQENQGLKKHDCQAHLLEFKLLGPGELLEPFEPKSDKVETR